MPSATARRSIDSSALDGKILLLGCDHDTVTFLHYAEHIVDIPGKRVARYRCPLTRTAGASGETWRRFDTSDEGAHPNWPDRFFARLVDTYLAQTSNSGGLLAMRTAFCWTLVDSSNSPCRVMKAVAADARAAAALEA